MDDAKKIPDPDPEVQKPKSRIFIEKMGKSIELS